MQEGQLKTPLNDWRICSSKARFVLLLKKKSAVYKDNVKNTDCIDSVTSTMNNKCM